MIFFDYNFTQLKALIFTEPHSYDSKHLTVSERVF